MASYTPSTLKTQRSPGGDTKDETPDKKKKKKKEKNTLELKF